MQSIDIKNAFEAGSTADNFTVLLLRLIAKSDVENRKKFSAMFPAEVEAVKIFQTACPYRIVDEYHPELNVDPDWDCINEWAHMATANKTGSTGNFPEGKVAPDDEGELKLAVFVDGTQKVVGMDFGKSVKWIAFNKEDAKNLGRLLIQKADMLG